MLEVRYWHKVLFAISLVLLAMAIICSTIDTDSAFVRISVVLFYIFIMPAMLDSCAFILGTLYGLATERRMSRWDLFGFAMFGINIAALAVMDSAVGLL